MDVVPGLCGAEDETQGFMYARQALHPLSYIHRLRSLDCDRFSG